MIVFFVLFAVLNAMAFVGYIGKARHRYINGDPHWFHTLRAALSISMVVFFIVMSVSEGRGLL